MKFKQHVLIGITFALVWLAHGQTLEVLHSFNGFDGSDPLAGLIQANDGNFYGTTSGGGSNEFGHGTVFKMTPEGEFTSLFTIDFPNDSAPVFGLLQDSLGDFYGTASNPFFDAGTVFKMTTNGLVTTLIQAFSSRGPFPPLPPSRTSLGEETSTFAPFGELLEGKDGEFYGSAYFGDAQGEGAIFRMNREGALTILYSFGTNNGFAPATSLIQDTNGDLYGTTRYGGTHHSGTVFKMTPAGEFTTLAEFPSPPGGAFGGRGYAPWGEKLVEGQDKSFYGTTLSGGRHDFGTVFKLTAKGRLRILISFKATTGGYPYAGLIQASDGNLYGVTSEFMPGENIFPHSGTLFKISPSGVFSILATFEGDNGAYPWGALLQGSDGHLYGTTRQGGSNDLGTVFRFLYPPLFAGVYSRVVPVGTTNAIPFTLKITSKMKFAGKMSLNGLKYPLLGEFPTNSFSVHTTTKRRGETPLNVDFSLVATNGNFQLIGTVSNSFLNLSLLGDRISLK